MNPPAVDVYARVQYGPRKLHRKRLMLAAAFCAACAFFIFQPERGVPAIFGQKLNADFIALLWRLGLMLGACWAAYELLRWLRPGKALVELVPQGLIMRLTTEPFIIPWSEIRGVDSIDVETSHRGRRVVFENVTVVLVPKFFYDRVIHVDSFIMRGPGWENGFIPKGDLLQVALHHEVLPATAEEIRRQVEARWKAFGKP